MSIGIGLYYGKKLLVPCLFFYLPVIITKGIQVYLCQCRSSEMFIIGKI
jgi:hypothetical protein